MANIKSAIKRIRVVKRQTAINKSRKSKYKNALKKMNFLLEKRNKKEALAFLSKLIKNPFKGSILKSDIK